MRLSLFAILGSLLQFSLLVHAFYPVPSFAKRKPIECPLEDPTIFRFAGESNTLPKAYNTLVSCPEITSLILTVRDSGCVWVPDPWAFRFRDGDQFPTLRNLSIHNYDFLHSGLQPYPHPLKAFDLQGQLQWLWDRMRMATVGSLGPEHAPSLDKWAQAMDWTGLERLMITGANNEYFYQRMKGELPSLRHFTTTTAGFSEPLREFLAHAPPLESLSLHSAQPLTGNNATLSCAGFFGLKDVLDRHGPTLKTLRLTQAESYTPGYRRLACNAADLAQLYRMAPRLTHLTLDVDRDGDGDEGWPYEVFNALVATGAPANLTTLHLRLELGANLHADEYMYTPSDDYGYDAEGFTRKGYLREPRMHWSLAREFFDILRDNKDDEPLTRLEIEVGDYDFDGPAYSGPIYIPHWIEGRTMKYVCEANEEGCQVLREDDMWD